MGDLLADLQALVGGNDARADVQRAAPRALTAALEVQAWTAALVQVAQQLASAREVATARALSRDARARAAQILAGPHTAAVSTRVPTLQVRAVCGGGEPGGAVCGREGVLPASVPRERPR